LHPNTLRSQLVSLRVDRLTLVVRVAGGLYSLRVNLVCGDRDIVPLVTLSSEVSISGVR